MTQGVGMRPRLLPFAALLTAAALVGGCDGSATATGTPTPGATGSAPVLSAAPDPCTLVTTAELEQALGETFTAGEPVAEADRRACTFAANETGDQVVINEYPLVGDLQELMAAATDVNKPPSPVPGVGRAAFRTDTQFYALLDRFVLAVVFVEIPPTETTAAALVTLGKAAAARA
jgi:hypothetical protein